MKNSAQGNVRKKKNLLIYPRFQLALLATNALAMLVAFGLAGFQVLRSYSKLRGLGDSIHLTQGHPYFKFVELQSETVITYLAAGAAMAFLFSLALTLLVSHRLAGPLVRLKSHLRRITESGEVTPIQFRKRDYFEDLPPLVNGAFEKVKRS